MDPLSNTPGTDDRPNYGRVGNTGIRCSSGCPPSQKNGRACRTPPAFRRPSTQRRARTTRAAAGATSPLSRHASAAPGTNATVIGRFRLMPRQIADASTPPGDAHEHEPPYCSSFACRSLSRAGDRGDRPVACAWEQHLIAESNPMTPAIAETAAPKSE